MRKRSTILRDIITIVFALAFASCGGSAAAPTESILRHPDPLIWDRPAFAGTPQEPSTEIELDLRGYDLSSEDLRAFQGELQSALFDDQTIWPDPAAMPPGFDPAEIMALGRNPGLGLRQLHSRGITGDGVGIALIDGSPLLVDHEEFTDRVRVYEETAEHPWGHAGMHATAVASFAAGETVGVAPRADLFLITTSVDYAGDFTPVANAIRRLLAIDAMLPDDQRIRVIAIPVGWQASNTGVQDMESAVAEAVARGIFVVTSSLEDTYGYRFQGLGRDPLADPNLPGSYGPGLFWSNYPEAAIECPNCLLIPMDSRTAASPTGTDEYVFYRTGGWSWSIPYIAGLYALAVQVDSTVTPERFWSAALSSGAPLIAETEGRAINVGMIVDPAALIEAIGP
jgi:hypothetical protein